MSKYMMLQHKEKGFRNSHVYVLVFEKLKKKTKNESVRERKLFDRPFSHILFKRENPIVTRGTRKAQWVLSRANK